MQQRRSIALVAESRPYLAERWLRWIGLALLIPAAAVDLIYHVFLWEYAAGLLLAVLGPEARNAHVLTLIGMLLVTISLVLAGVRSSARRRATRRRASPTHATKLGS